MLEKLRVVFTIPELRRKIFLTLFLLAVYRVGYQIPMPMVDGEVLQTQSQSTAENPLSTLVAKAAVFSGSNLSQATIFGLGIMPYITASIILQLLGTVYPPLMELRKREKRGGKRSTNTQGTSRWSCALSRVLPTSGFFLWGKTRQGIT